jgi:uncharacterized protein
MKFEWDEAKNRINIAKHGLSFQMAAKVFFDPKMQDVEDEGYEGEDRWNAIGIVNGRVLFVTYTERGNRIRIISARGAEPHERRRYYRSI